MTKVIIADENTGDVIERELDITEDREGLINLLMAENSQEEENRGAWPVGLRSIEETLYGLTMIAVFSMGRQWYRIFYVLPKEGITVEDLEDERVCLKSLLNE